MNKTYIEVDNRILRAVRTMRRKVHFLTVRALAKEAKIAESTMYRHYASMEIMIDTQKGRIDAKIGEMVKTVEKMSPKLTMEAGLQRVLLLFYSERDAIGTLLAVDGVEQMLAWFAKIRPIIVRDWPKYNQKRLDAIFGYCSWVMTEEFFSWKREHYNKKSIELHAKHLAWIARNIPKVYNSMTTGEDD